MDMISEIIDKRAQLFNFFCIRHFMRTVHKRNLLPEIILRNGFICRQHKILNDLCRRIAVIRFNVYRMSLIIQNYFRLWKIKINGTTFPTFCTQQICHLLHIQKHPYKIFVLFCFLRIFQRNNFIYIGITHAAVNVDDRFCDPMIHDVSFCINFHNTAQSQSILALI